MGWLAVLLAAAADPLFAEVVHADAVVVGTVTAVEPKPFRAADEWGNSSRWRAVAVRVHACWRGPVRPGERRFAYREGADHLRHAEPLVPPVSIGRRCVLLLSGQADGLPVVHHRPAPGPESPAGEQVRRACAVLNDPVGGLTAAAPAGRYFAAALLAEHYAMWRPSGWWSCRGPPRNRFVFDGPPPVPVPADQSRLILRAFAERADWQTGPPGLRPPAGLLDPQSGDGLGLTAADGWTWPEPSIPPDRVAGSWDDLQQGLAGRPGFRLAARRTAAPSWFGRPLPPTPVPTEQRDDFVFEAAYWWCGTLDREAVLRADRAGLARDAFGRWLDGPGERCQLRTTAGALRPPAGAGGWHHPPAGGPGWPGGRGRGTMRPEVTR